MEENENNEVVNKDEIKEETMKTAREVRDTIKNVDFKNDAKATKGFVTEMFKNPLERLKQIANDETHKDFKFAVLLAIVWAIAILILYLTTHKIFTYNFGSRILSLVKSAIAPIIGILIMSAIIFLMNKNNKKSFVTVLTSVTTAKIPVIIANVVGLLRIISSSMSRILSPFSAFCSVISIVLMFFATKSLFGEEDNSKFLKTFVIIEGIYYIAYLIISYLEIYI